MSERVSNQSLSTAIAKVKRSVKTCPFRGVTGFPYISL